MSEGTPDKPVTRRDWLRSGSAGLIGAGFGAGFRQVSISCAEENATVTREKDLREKDLHPEEFRKMVALGESTTAGGWSTSRDRCWVSVLGALVNDFQARPMEVVNAGIGANVISTRSPCYLRSGKPAASERLDKHVIAQRPDLLILSYGLNDARGGTPIGLFRQEMIAIIRRVRKAINPLIVLLGPYYMTNFALGGATWAHGSLALFGQYNKLIARIAREESCLYVDLLAGYDETDWMIHYDGVHANDLGHRVVAHRIFEVLAQRCSGLAKKTKKAEKTSPRWRDESTLKSDYGY